MIALRQIQIINDDSLTIKLPPEFRDYKQAEIIILPFDEAIKKTDTEAFIQKFSGSIIDFPALDALLPEERDSLE